MSVALRQFEANLSQAKDLVGLALAVDAATTDALDTSDLLRSALVAGVSALDHFVHEVVRQLMIDTAIGTRAPTDAFLRFPISTEATMRAAAGDPPQAWLNEEIRRQHGHLSFQQPDKIAEAIRLIWDQPLWPTIASHLGSDPKLLKQQLQLVVARRNQIAHEADRDPTPPHERWPILATDVDAAVALIGSIARTIDAAL